MTTATKTKAQAPAKENQLPIHKARIGALQLAVWENRAVDNKGEERVYKTATMERGYTDKDGEWVNERLNMNARDFGDMIALLQNGQQFLIKSE